MKQEEPIAMNAYKVSDLYNKLSELANDGYEYVNVYVLDADEDSPEALNFEAIEEADCSIDYENVECSTIPADYCYSAKTTRSIKATDYCCELNFTYEELDTIKHSIDNALEYFHELLKDSSQPRDIINEIKQSSVKCRNLQAKLAHFFKRFH